MFYVPFDTKLNHFRVVLPIQSLNLVLTKKNLTQQKQTVTSKPKDTTTQNENTTKARFGCLEQC